MRYPLSGIPGAIAMEGATIVRLLIVDDEKHICEEFRETLEHEGFEVDCALNGKEGLKKAQQNPYDLIFLDESMPQMTGEKVLEKIRQVSPAPVAFISGFMTPAKERKVMSMGAMACLHKPLDLEHLKALIRSIEKKRHII